jgi:DNA-binding transcriptional LysR family regulator
MKISDLPGIDFRSLRALKLVHDLRSFSEAAERLGQNQSTISYVIRRLRDAFDDPLFVRQGRSIAPTPRCVEIVAGIERLFDQLADMVEPSAFDPSAAAVEVTISCNHYERAVILPRVVRRLRREAAGIRLRVRHAKMEGHDQLRRGECDLLLSPVASDGDGLFRRLLIEDSYVCVMDRSNPLAGGPVTVEAFATANHVFISYEGIWRPTYREVVEGRGIAARMVLDLPSTGEVGRLIAGTDLVATVTNLLARTYGQGLVIKPGPFDSQVRVYQYWTTRTHRSRVHRWLRDLIAEEAAAVAASASSEQMEIEPEMAAYA